LDLSAGQPRREAIVDELTARMVQHRESFWSAV